jgi:hypothetical protein
LDEARIKAVALGAAFEAALKLTAGAARKPLEKRPL